MKTQLKAIIFDDEASAIENLKRDLYKFFPFIEVIHTCDRLENLQSLLKYHPDILFLDIELHKGLTIFPFLETIPYQNYNIIFHTGFNKYMEQALNVSCISYIHKDRTPEEFVTKMQSALNKIEANRNISMDVLLHNFREKDQIKKQKFSIHTEKAYVPVNYIDIHFISTKPGKKKTVTFHLSNNTVLEENKNIGEIEERLAGNELFYRIYQSDIIGIHGIKQIKREGKTTYIFMHLKNKRLHVSEDRLNGFWNWYNKHTR